MTTKSKSTRAHGKKGVTLADLRSQLDQTGHLPADDVDAIVATAYNARRKERKALRRKRSKTGS